MTLAAASTSSWDAAEYARVGGFVSRLGGAALDLLDPRQGERILDVGCGEGALTQQIVDRGATVVGIDSSPSMVEAACARGLDARLMDAAAMSFAAEFDAGFSNAALHWMLDRQAAAAAVFRALKPGARFAGEMGGQGNLAKLRAAIRAELSERGYPVPPADPQWYPSPAEFAAVYRAAGFADVRAELIERPTLLEHGVAAWVLTFRAGWLDAAKVPETERPALAQAIEKRLEATLRDPGGRWFADYIRLRFSMRKPF
uniref:class I SAM-dependent methyltransferase n=1 Tax=uncultured Sphingomonas sp. TaxID=158754 RepID=UPI0025D70FA8|nr:class I SAM-dependent methyltransferase [uncultured Sphingomonas sp.]